MFGRGGGTVQTTFTAKDNMSPVVRGIRASMDGFKRDAATGFGLGAGISVFQTAQRAFGAAVDFMGDAMSVASDLTEQQSKVGAVFKESSDEVTDWAQNLDASFGLSERAALTMAGTLGNLFTSMGIGADQASDMSRGLSELAGDLASFNNADIQDVMTALRSGIVGETEPMRRLGVDINAAAVEAKALALGLAATKSQLTGQDKIAARYALIMEQTANAQGDAARTSETLAGKQRALNARMEDLQSALGRSFLGPATDFLGWLSNIIDILDGPDGVNAGLRETADRIRNIGNAAASVVQMDEFNDQMERWTTLISGSEFRTSRQVFEWMQQLGPSALASLADASVETSAEIENLGQALSNEGKSFEQFDQAVRRSVMGTDNYLRNILPGAFAAFTSATDEVVGEGVTDFKSLGTALGKTFGAMFSTLAEAKEPWKTAFKDLAKWAKDPFRPDNFERWMNRQAKKFMDRAKDQLEAGKPGAARRSRQIAAAIKNPIVGALVDIGVEAGAAIRALLAVQQFGRVTARVADTVFDNISGFLGSLSGNGGVEGGRRRNRRGNRAAGGPVEANSAYTVGENGRETLVMGDQPGYIIPNGRHNNQPIVIHQTVTLDGRVVARSVDRHQGRSLNFVGSSSR